MTGRGERQGLRKLTVPEALSWSREEDMIEGVCEVIVGGV